VCWDKTLYLHSSFAWFRVCPGKKTVDDMFTMLEDENRVITWILRAISLVLTIVGLQLITAPLTVVADIIPLIGPAISGIIGTLASAAAAGCSSQESSGSRTCPPSSAVHPDLHSSIASLPPADSFTGLSPRYRPTIGIPLLIVAILGAVAAVGAVVVHKKKQVQLPCDANTFLPPDDSPDSRAPFPTRFTLPEVSFSVSQNIA
jgi:hypothetical protein